MEYNCKIIDYGEYYHVQFYDKTLTRVDNKENYTKEEIIEDNQVVQLELPIKERTKEEENHALQSSLNRSKNNFYRIARSNNWDLFITLTFDRNKVDSSDYDLVVRKLKTYLSNLRQRKYPDMIYLFVPEFHKDGVHFHFHGLIGGCNLDLIDSGHKDFLGNIIYNIPSWGFGFTTATKVKDSKAVGLYIGKYISKDLLNRLPNKHRYYASKNCNICEEQYCMIPPDELFEYFGDNIEYLKTISVPLSGQRIKYLEIKK